MPARSSPECFACGSLNTRTGTGIFATGVLAPDGECEQRTSEYIACLDCGAVEEL